MRYEIYYFKLYTWACTVFAFFNHHVFPWGMLCYQNPYKSGPALIDCIICKLGSASLCIAGCYSLASPSYFPQPPLISWAAHMWSWQDLESSLEATQTVDDWPWLHLLWIVAWTARWLTSGNTAASLPLPTVKQVTFDKEIGCYGACLDIGIAPSDFRMHIRTSLYICDHHCLPKCIFCIALLLGVDNGSSLSATNQWIYCFCAFYFH